MLPAFNYILTSLRMVCCTHKYHFLHLKRICHWTYTKQKLCFPKNIFWQNRWSKCNFAWDRVAAGEERSQETYRVHLQKHTRTKKDKCFTVIVLQYIVDSAPIFQRFFKFVFCKITNLFCNKTSSLLASGKLFFPLISYTLFCFNEIKVFPFQRSSIFTSLCHCDTCTRSLSLWSLSQLFINVSILDANCLAWSLQIPSLSLFLKSLATLVQLSGLLYNDLLALACIGLLFSLWLTVIVNVLCAGLSLVVGLVLYISSINDEVMNRPREPEQFFNYHYGWSFAFAASSFLLKEVRLVCVCECVC